MSTQITKVILTGDQLEVQAVVDGSYKAVKRNVLGYVNLTDEEKQNLWYDIIGIPQKEFEHGTLSKIRTALTIKRKI